MSYYYTITYDVLEEEKEGLENLDTKKFKEELIKLLLKLGINDIWWRNKTTILVKSKKELLGEMKKRIDNLKVNVDYFIVSVELFENQPIGIENITQEDLERNFDELVKELKGL